MHLYIGLQCTWYCPSVHLDITLLCILTFPFGAPRHFPSVHLGIALQCMHMIWPYRAPGHCPSVHLTFYTDLQCTRTLPFSAPGHWHSVHLVLTYNAPGLCLQCTGTSTYCTLYSAPGHWPSVLRDLELQCTWAMPHSAPRLSLRYTENEFPCNWTLNFSASDIDLQCTWTVDIGLQCSKT